MLKRRFMRLRELLFHRLPLLIQHYPNLSLEGVFVSWFSFLRCGPATLKARSCATLESSDGVPRRRTRRHQQCLFISLLCFFTSTLGVTVPFDITPDVRRSYACHGPKPRFMRP